MKKKLLIVNKAQFGYHTDTFKYCQYLKDDFEITYFCFYNRLPKKKVDNVKVVYVSHYRNLLKNVYSFFYKMYTFNKGESWDIIFIKNFDFCFLVRFIAKGTHYILDLRTGSVAFKTYTRLWQDLKTRVNILFFSNFSIISHGLADKFNINRYFLLPLGADEISIKSKKFSPLKLLYVGTLDNRNIEETIVGVKLFLKDMPNGDITYDIFAKGSEIDREKIRKVIKDNSMEDFVKFHGRKSHEELIDYFDNCNIGISYIPITDYYEYQPSTKTFEYIFSGLVCVATNTKSNAELIDKNNGILCDDNPESFGKALKKIHQKREGYDSDLIRTSLLSYSWKNICKNILKPYLNNFQ